MQVETRFRAMNTDVDVVTESRIPAPGVPLSVRLLFEQQEARFSRFIGSSLLSRLNRGKLLDDPLFAAGCRMALAAYEETDGLFNPLILPALLDAGYDRSFEALEGAAVGTLRRHDVGDPRLVLRFEGDAVRLTAGQLDLGGIVKGWTVDLACEQFSMGIDGLLVNAGGDLRAVGSEEGSDGWLISITDGQNGARWAGTMRGALATSTVERRRWLNRDGSGAHHLIDPRTGLPADGPFVQASVWAPTARQAEVWSKAIVIGGEAAGQSAMRAGLRILAIAEDGEERWFG